MERTTHYPHHLAKHVTAELRRQGRPAPPETVLTRLLEVLYFASLKTDEGRPTLCTVNFVDRAGAEHGSGAPTSADRWSFIPLERPTPLDVRALTRLARAVDPSVSSLVVSATSRNELMIRGLVDQELRYSDCIALDASNHPERAGLFQATINGVGNVSVYVNYDLVGSLEQSAVIGQFHDVLWTGPVHRTLAGNLRRYLAAQHSAAQHSASPGESAQAVGTPLENALLVRWLNAICRVLMNIQRYRHGGGLLIAPDVGAGGLHIKYKIHYDRLPRALSGLLKQHVARTALTAEIDRLRRRPSRRWLPVEKFNASETIRRRLDEHKNEALGCAHFIASLSCVDGFVLLDHGLTVHGFGVEVRADHYLSDIFVAGDDEATPSRLRHAEISQLGTRHRAMMRYCYQHPGALGFVISQDGDIRAMTKIDERLILWENIDVQLAFKAESALLAGPHVAPRAASPRVA